MKQPADIRFLGIAPSPALHALIIEQCGKLEVFSADITSCRVFVELADKHQHRGRKFDVRIDLTLPGHELTVNRARSEDVYGALNDAFHAMARQIEDTVRRDRRHRGGSTPVFAEENLLAVAAEAHATSITQGGTPC
jgi:ribosomal subunit interface protein